MQMASWLQKPDGQVRYPQFSECVDLYFWRSYFSSLVTCLFIYLFIFIEIIAAEELASAAAARLIAEKDIEAEAIRHATTKSATILSAATTTFLTAPESAMTEAARNVEKERYVIVAVEQEALDASQRAQELHKAAEIALAARVAAEQLAQVHFCNIPAR